MTQNPNTGKPAWVQLYEARRAAGPVESKTPGRPPAPVPRHKIGLTLSQGEVRELEVWQERFCTLLQRKVSFGETVGILTRICTARFERLAPGRTLRELSDLVDEMIGQ
jgi:hypothetical protein